MPEGFKGKFKVVLEMNMGPFETKVEERWEETTDGTD